MQISDIKPGSVGDRCGALCIGDKILSINHQILAKCTVQEALNILHSSSDTVSLQIEKNFTNDSKFFYIVDLYSNNLSSIIVICKVLRTL